jgi:tetratricopeptide (TPR) repeat protein
LPIIAIFDRVVTTLPDFAEGWNKRATVHYLNEDYTASVIDIERTLVLEPRHFGAISGMGLIFMARGDEAGALRAFEEVLKIHPHARGAKARVEELRKKLRAKTKGSALLTEYFWCDKERNLQFN